MKRYWLFGWDNHYPSGGLEDIIHMTDDPLDLMAQWKCNHYYENMMALDTETFETIHLGQNEFHIDDYRWENITRLPLTEIQAE